MVLRAAAAVASIALLAGCASAPAPPPGLDPAVVKTYIDEQDSLWWASMFPGEPQPEVEAVEHVSSAEVAGKVNSCVLNASPPGVDITYEGSFSTDDPAADAALNRQWFVCSLQYPLDLSNPAAAGFLSDAQLRYLYAYYRERLVPCLRSIGYTFPALPTLDNRLADQTVNLGGGQYWLPYYVIRPQPRTHAQWDYIDLHCAPPPYLADARPPITVP